MISGFFPLSLGFKAAAAQGEMFIVNQPRLIAWVRVFLSSDISIPLLSLPCPHSDCPEQLLMRANIAPAAL